ncbi:MAG: hypothetical protein OES25_07985 [Acidobacteriota bacterium]|nr:hypothetical protein [Acidobacteriota bacterium]
MCRFLSVLIATSLVVLCTAAADPLHLTGPFDHRDPIEIRETDGNGIRIDQLRFRLPATVGGSHSRVGGEIAVDILVSNTSDATTRIGLVVALFDGEQHLLGAATGGSRLRGLKPGRARTYRLVFDDVNDRAYQAAQFRLTLESHR